MRVVSVSMTTMKSKTEVLEKIWEMFGKIGGNRYGKYMGSIWEVYVKICGNIFGKYRRPCLRVV